MLLFWLSIYCAPGKVWNTKHGLWNILLPKYVSWAEQVSEEELELELQDECCAAAPAMLPHSHDIGGRQGRCGRSDICRGLDSALFTPASDLVSHVKRCVVEMMPSVSEKLVFHAR